MDTLICPRCEEDVDAGQDCWNCGLGAERIYKCAEQAARYAAQMELRDSFKEYVWLNVKVSDYDEQSIQLEAWCWDAAYEDYDPVEQDRIISIFKSKYRSHYRRKYGREPGKLKFITFPEIVEGLKSLRRGERQVLPA